MTVPKTPSSDPLQDRPQGPPAAPATARPIPCSGCTRAPIAASLALVVRAFLRDAAACEVVLTGDQPPSVLPMKSLAAEGLFEVFIPRRAEVCAYELRATSADGRVRQFRDPYCFLPTLGDQDLYLFNEGNEHRIYDKLGAHVRDLGGVLGVAFAVWAPAAHARLGHRRLQRLGRALPPDEGPRGLGRLGDLHPRPGRGGALQVRDPRQPGRHPHKDRPLRHLLRGASRERGQGVRDRAASRGATRHGWSGGARRPGTSTGRSRSTRSTSAPGAGSPRRGTARSPTARSRRSWPTTRPRWGSPTSR